MAHILDPEPIIKRITAAQIEMFKEEIRKLQAAAWEEGYAAADNGRDERTNPYLKEY